MLAVTRFQVAEADTEAFTTGAGVVVDTLSRCAGCRRAQLGRAADDPGLWALVSEWDGAGPYRRALSSYDVRVALMPLVVDALDEPGAFELVTPASR
ncbi:MAG: antibiotic biosynthesis monooxygenase family protein [Frankia sp.]